MSNPTNPADGQYVVVENGQRVSMPMTKEQAETEAQKRNQLAESGGTTIPEHRKAQVKQNLFG
jgi:hypothetical protein